MNSMKSVAAALGLAAVVALPAAALAGSATSPIAESMRIHQPTTAVLHPVKGLYETWGTSVVSLAAGYTAIDGPTVVNCTRAKGCSLHASNSVQVLAGADGGQWCIGTQVDGNWMNHACYFQGVINTADLFKTGNDQENVNISYGTHSVQTYVYMDYAGSLGSFQNDYTLTAP